MQAGRRWSRWSRTMEQAIDYRVEGAGWWWGGGVTIAWGRRDSAMMRSGKEKYNNQQWLMGGGKRRGKAIAMMIMACKMAEFSKMTMHMTKGGTKEDDAFQCFSGSCCCIPLSSSLLHVSPPAPTVMVAWAVVWVVGVAVKEDNCFQNGGGHQHWRLMLTSIEWMRMVRVQKI